MKNWFQPDGPVLILLSKITATVWLNILWLICSLPVFTIGASTTALYTVTLKMAKDEEGNITRQFFDAFRDNFRSSTRVWLILLGFGLILAADGYVLYHLRYENAFWTILTAVLIVIAAGYAVILLYVFPLMARFDNTAGAMLKNSLVIGIRFLFCTFFLVVIHFGMAVIVVRFFTPAVIFGEGLCAYLSSCLLTGVLAQCEGKQ